MKPDDLIDAMEYISDDLVEEARNHRKMPPAWLRWSAVALCVCCATIAVGSFLLRGQMTSSTATEPEAVVSNAPESWKNTQELAKQAIPLEIFDATASHNPTSYDICVEDDLMYFLYSYSTVYVYNAQNQMVQKLLEGENCTLTQTDTGIYCKAKSSAGDDYTIYALSQGQVTELDTLGGTDTTGVTLVDAVDETLYWVRVQNDGCQLCATDITTHETQVLLSQNYIEEGIIRDGVFYYSGSDTGVMTFDLDTGETTVLPWCYEGDYLEVSVVFFQDFMLQAVDVFSTQEDGSLSDEWCYYLVPYDAQEPEAITGYDGTLAYWGRLDNRLYFEVYHNIEDSGGWSEYVTYDITTGEFAPVMKNDGRSITELVPFAGGFYYASPNATDGGLYCYDSDTDTSILIMSVNSVETTASME